jgi:Na+/H+ antiporter NhaA
MASTVATGTSPGTGRTAWERNLRSPVRRFLHTETAGAVVLAAAAVLALLWANSPWSDTYESLWQTELSIRLGDHALSTDLRGWVNEGLLTLFFLGVGLEAKRELDLGELRDRRRLALPVIAALSGMLFAALVYLAINAGGDGASGWGAAVSTDTALALGTLTLLTRGRAGRMRVFLLTLVVIDDLVALAIIGFVYSTHIDFVALLVAAGLAAVLFALRYAGSWRAPAAAITAVAFWGALFLSGVDAVVAGLAIGLVTSAYPPSRGDLERSTQLARSFREQPTPELAVQTQRSLAAAISPNDRLQYRLHPWNSRVIVPLFALANAGLTIDGDLLRDAATSPITLGILAAYLVGKPAGIVAGSALSTTRALGRQRPPVTWPTLVTGASFAGIGFTVSLLVAGLAFDGGELREATIGILLTALLSPLVGQLSLVVVRTFLQETRTRQLAATAERLVDLVDDVDPEVDHLRGSPVAPVILLEYGDFECPYCGRAEQTIRELLGSAGMDLCYVFRHLPLNDVHANADLAAQAAEAAAAQGKFWQMHDILFAHQDALAPKDIVRYAQELGLDLERFRDDLRTRAARRTRRGQRRRQRRLRHADLLHQRPPPLWRLRHRKPHERHQRREGAGQGHGRRELIGATAELLRRSLTSEYGPGGRGGLRSRCGLPAADRRPARRARRRRHATDRGAR